MPWDALAVGVCGLGLVADHARLRVRQQTVHETTNSRGTMAGVKGRGRKAWNAMMAREGVAAILPGGVQNKKRKRSSGACDGRTTQPIPCAYVEYVHHLMLLWCLCPGRVKSLSRFVKRVDKDTRTEVRQVLCMLYTSLRTTW